MYLAENYIYIIAKTQLKGGRAAGARHRIRRVHQRAEGREHPAQPEDARRDSADRALLIQGLGGHREADARVPRGPSKGVRRIRCVRACEASGGGGAGVGRE